MNTLTWERWGLRRAIEATPREEAEGREGGAEGGRGVAELAGLDGAACGGEWKEWRCWGNSLARSRRFGSSTARSLSIIRTSIPGKPPLLSLSRSTCFQFVLDAWVDGRTFFGGFSVLFWGETKSGFLMK